MVSCCPYLSSHENVTPDGRHSLYLQGQIIKRQLQHNPRTFEILSHALQSAISQ